MSLKLRGGVTRGLDPRVHLFRKMMDGRVKPGHDDAGSRRDAHHTRRAGIARVERVDRVEGLAAARLCRLQGCFGITSESESNPFIAANPATALNWMMLLKVGCALTAARMAAAVFGATVLK